MNKLGKRLSNFWKERKIRNYNAEKLAKFIVQISENVKKITEEHKKDTEGFIEQISEIGEKNKKQYDELIALNKEQNTELTTQSRKQNKELTKQFLMKSEKQTSEFINQFSRKFKLDQEKFIEQVLEKNKVQIIQLSEQILDKFNYQNSIVIKQNTKLIEQILSQSLENHGTINKKFNELVTYQALAEFREKLTIVKTSIVILENLDDIKFKITHRLYLKYHKLHSEIPLLDITRGMIIIKLPFPPFFKQMSENLLVLKNQFDEKTYRKMTDVINHSDWFFQNFDKNPDRLLQNKILLDSVIDVLNKRLAELIKIN